MGNKTWQENRVNGIMNQFTIKFSHPSIIKWDYIYSFLLSFSLVEQQSQNRKENKIWNYLMIWTHGIFSINYYESMLLVKILDDYSTSCNIKKSYRKLLILHIFLFHTKLVYFIFQQSLLFWISIINLKSMVKIKSLQPPLFLPYSLFCGSLFNGS